MKTCQRRLAEHYQKTAKVPTTAWSSLLKVDLEQIYTRLSWVKQEQTTAGRSQKKLTHYTEIFTEKTTNRIVAKRILVQGETGIGKTTFVKKLFVDWSNLEEAKMGEEQKDALRKFHLVLAVNLKEVSECQTLEEVLSRSRLFPKDDKKSVDDLLCYIEGNQYKVLLVFDGYDEYRTGNKAEEKYGSRENSPVFGIFHGDILRECTVLVTTRSSRADEIRGPADIQAEITGFNKRDRKDFMRKMLDSQTEVDGLLDFLKKSELNDLARVPLLSLFFCLLWKREKGKLMELTERKAKLYQAIVKHILQHSHRRHSCSKTSKLKETDYDEILAEIGKVALAGLLKGDLVFEFGQLSEKVRGEEGVVVGLFQFSEYGPSQEPMEMVSFIHKSVQEYLAAWYLIYSCVPKGNLGEIGQHAATMKNCVALENVFQFVCGLSAEGAMKVLEHLKSVRISDPTLDLSKTIPDVETETDVPLFDVTNRHVRFSDLIHDSFREVQSKPELLSYFLDCTGGVILVPRDMLLSELMPNVNVLTKMAQNCVFIFIDVFRDLLLHECVEDSVMYKSLDFLNCLQTLLRVTDSSDALTVEDFMRKFYLKSSCSCSVNSILCFRNDQFQFYITELFLECDDHARLFTESTTTSGPSNSASSCPEQSCLKFLSSLGCRTLSNQTVKGLGAVIGNCVLDLSRIQVDRVDDSICYLLEQVRKPSKCSVSIGNFTPPSIIAFRFLLDGHSTHLTSVGAVRLASLLPRFNDVIALNLDLRDCSAAAQDTLVATIIHKTLMQLTLCGIILTPAATKTLGRSLSEMSSLQELVLTGFDGSILQTEEMEALFGGFNKSMHLYKLTFSGFGTKSCLAPLIKRLPFFPNLRELRLGKLNIDEDDQCCLLKSFGFLTVTNLKVCIHEKTGPDSFRYRRKYVDETLELDVISLNPAVAAVLGRLLPEMSSLQELVLTGFDGSILQTEQMEALFGGFNKSMPLYELTFSGFNVRGCLAPLIKSLPFFPNLREFMLEKSSIDEHDKCCLLKSFGFLTVTNLYVCIHEETCLDSFQYCTEYASGDKILTLDVLSLTPAVAAVLGRLLPDLSSLQQLELTGFDGSILPAAEMEALFGGFNKTLPLHALICRGFSARGCFAPLFRSFRFFPNLTNLNLANLNMDELDLHGLLESFQFIPNLELLNLSDNPLGHAVTSIVPHVINLKELQFLRIHNTGHSEEDLNYVRNTVQQALPKLEISTEKKLIFSLDFL